MKKQKFIEKELVNGLKMHEQKAWKFFFEKYSGNLTYVCSRYISREEDIKDILQDSFIKMFSSIKSFEHIGEGSLRAWGKRIVVNTCIDSLKKEKKVTTTNQFEWIYEESGEENPDINELPQSIILELISSLPDAYRTVFNLYVFERKSHKEIAEILGIGESSSASNLHRAKKILVDKINEFNKEAKLRYE